jgi:hypothetical protein
MAGDVGGSTPRPGCASGKRDHAGGKERYGRDLLSVDKEGRIMLDYEVFELGDVPLRMGATLRDAKLAYKTYGTLNQAKSNAIVYPTWYSGQHYENEWLIGEGMALDPSRYFIIIPNMFGNGLSSSPDNTPPPYDRARFPRVTFQDVGARLSWHPVPPDRDLIRAGVGSEM